jgi:hypothetical protein
MPRRSRFRIRLPFATRTKLRLLQQRVTPPGAKAAPPARKFRLTDSLSSPRSWK